VTVAVEDVQATTFDMDLHGSTQGRRAQ